MPVDAATFQVVMNEIIDYTMKALDADIVEAVAAGDEATQEQRDLLVLLFESGGPDHRRETEMPDVIEDVRADELQVGDRIEMDGAVRTVTKIGRDEHRLQKECPDCGGNGGEPPPCETCADSGKVPDTDSPQRQAVALDLDLTSQPTTAKSIRRHLGYEHQVRRVETLE